MAEVIIALGVIGSVVSCIEMGSKVADRLEYYLSRTKSPPQVFVTLYDTLPLLITTFEEIRDACNDGTLDLEAQKRLTKTVEGCHRLVTTLEDYLQECLPVEGDSFAHTMKKAVKSIRSEKTIGEIQRNLETYKSTLTLYFSHLTAVASTNQSLLDAPGTGRYFEVPAMNVQRFVGRQRLLEEIDGHLRKEEKEENCTKIVVLRGRGGQGKTQLALEYTRKQRASHSIFWVDATSSGTAFRSFENIGAKVAPGATFPNPEAARTYLLRALEALNDPLLFVFDTFDQPGEFTTVRDFFPYGAKIILTSRHNDSKRLGSSIEVGAMPDDEGVELLLHQAGLQHTTENIDSAIAITKELGGLALAIDQAATYISARHVPLHAFPGVYEKRRAAIFKHTPTQWEYKKSSGHETEQSVSVFTTWEMSFEQLEATGQERDAIIHLLTLGAFINTNNIGEGLFSLYSQQTNRPDWMNSFLDHGVWDSEKFQDTIVRLSSVSLVTIDLMSNDARISFHPLVAEWLKLRIDLSSRAQYTEEAIRVDKSETLAHIDKIIEHDRAFHVNEKHISDALKEATVSFGSFYRRLGRYHETQGLIERAMSDKDVSPAVRNVLANMYCDQGEFEKAEKLYNKVLNSLGRSLPEKSSEKLHVSTLGFLYWTQDDKLTEDGLSYAVDYAANLHQFHPWFASALSTYNGLGVLYMKIGRLDTAEKLLKEALDGREKAVGPDASFTAEIINHLGALYTQTGDYEKASNFLSRALKCLYKAFGPYYMTTQLTEHHLGILYMQQNRLDDAEEIILRTTRYLENGFGPAHASTLSAYHNLAILYSKQNRVDEARKLLEQTIKGWKESAEGVAKPEADSKSCLANLSEPGEAERLFQEAAELYSLALGKDHPQTKEAFEKKDAAHINAGVGRVSLAQ